MLSTATPLRRSRRSVERSKKKKQMTIIPIFLSALVLLLWLALIAGSQVAGVATAMTQDESLVPPHQHQHDEVADASSHYLRHEQSAEGAPPVKDETTTTTTTGDATDKTTEEKQQLGEMKQKAAEMTKEVDNQQQQQLPDEEPSTATKAENQMNPLGDHLPKGDELPSAADEKHHEDEHDHDEHYEHEHDEHEDEEIGESAAKGDGSEDEEENPEDYYFYAFDEKSPVIEEPRYEGTPDLAPFIWDPPPGQIRIVEFYAHWCPHCEKFKPKFNKFAKRMMEIAEQSGMDLKVYAVSCVPHRYICKKNDVHNYPRVKLFLGGATEGIEIPHKNLHPFEVLKRIGTETMGKEAEGLAITDGTWEEDEEEEDVVPDSAAALLAPDGSFWIPRTKKEIYNDAYLSFDFAMRNAIFAQKDPLSEEAKDAFYDFVGLLAEILPPTWRLQWMISEIVENEATVLENEENLFKILDKYPPKKKKWSKSCMRGKGSMGYTCGLWQLFHIMTIGMVEWNLNNVAGKRKSFYSTNETADTLRAFIEHFFGCEVCRINFMQEYDSCSFNRCERLIDQAGTFNDWKELPLWLFEFHNAVNTRLMYERAEAESRKASSNELLSVEWPSRKHCPSCWYSDGRFDPDRVYMFLQLIYWPDELISKTKMAELVAFTKHRDAGSVEDGLDPMMEEGYASWVYSLAGLILASIVLSAASWAQKKQEIKRTGKHKKEDDSGNKC